MEQSAITLERLRTFTRIAERGTLSAVAREFGVGQSTITRHLSELETALGVSLFTRTTRRVRLTEEGTRYYCHCQKILGLVEQASQDMQETSRATGGTIRISCTSAFGILHVSRLIFAFQTLHPAITMELSVTDEQVDLLRDGIDIAIRLAPLADSSLKLRSLGQSRRLLVATPTWIERHGPLRKPKDLAGLEGIRLSRVQGSDKLHLTTPGGQKTTIPFQSRLNVDHGLTAREALLAGRGFGPAHQWLIQDCLKDGRLAVILPEHTLPPIPLSMLILPERAPIARIRLCADFLAAQIAKIPGIHA